MKLRNKKTGEVADLECITLFECSSRTLGIGESIDVFYTIAELNEKWEDYKPAEPLIKDEKIRKAVQAWADINNIERVWHEYASCWLRGNGLKIELENDEVIDLKQRNYTIGELCGEEEE